MSDGPCRMRILVIDDNPDDRQLEMREVYALFPDANVLELTDFAEFERALEDGEPDLVLTDLDLRWSNGREVLATVKAQYPCCPVVMFTGTGDETIAVELMKSGLNDYVVKSPRQLSRLRTSLKIAVDLARSRATLSEREHHLANALAQQQVIVRELHHRVKNNLQTVTSLLHLSGQSTDESTRAHLDEIAGRMEALGAVQSRIYETAQFDKVDFRAALTDIASSLSAMHPRGKVILAMSEGDRLEFEVSRAMPLSLLCYEVILNAVKHAWPNTAPGTLTVDFSIGEVTRLRIADDGVGYSAGDVVTGLGTRLIHSLAREARVTMETMSTPGTGTVTVLTCSE